MSLPPFTRTTVAQTCRVVCAAWHNPQAINRWLYELDIFRNVGHLANN